MAVKEINWTSLIERLKNENPEKIILFGSYARGTPSSESDIDVLVIKNIPKEEQRNEKLRLKRKLRDFVLSHGISIDVHLANPENIKKRIDMGDKFYQDILEKGKVLYAK